MKLYIKNLIKKYIPFYAVSFAIVISMFLIFVSVAPNFYSEHIIEDMSYVDGKPFSALLFFIIPLAFLTTIAPFFANSYRYSIKSVDVFYQTGKGDRKIRLANNLTLLVSILIIYTAAFIIIMSLLMIKQLPMAGKDIVVSESSDSKVIRHYFAYNFGYYFLAYFLALIFSSANYFISYFFITRSNNLLNSMITLVLGQALLSTLFMTPFWYVALVKTIFGANSLYQPLYLPGTRAPSIIGPYALLQNIFEGLIVEGKVNIINISLNGYGSIPYSLTLSIISLSIFALFAGFSIYTFIKEKESSGELAGKAYGRDKSQLIIFHVAAGLIALWQGVSSGLGSFLAISIISAISSFVMYCVFYYVFYGLIRRDFRLKKKDVITLLSISSIYIVSYAFIAIISSINLTPIN